MSDRNHQNIASVLDDELFFDALYATLTAWGLHRMGPGNTKLRPLDDIRASVREQASALEELATLDITDLHDANATAVAGQIWKVLTRLRVSVAAAQIVANSKTLHHLLPALVPPMDREYTFRFFYGRNMLSVDEQTAFSEMFTRLSRVATVNKAIVRNLVDGVWNTSPAKVVDNAVVGYMISHEGAKPPNNALEPATRD